MDRDELKNMAGNPDFIPGIYNYCDRWCERCFLSSKCLLFSMEVKKGLGSKNYDLESQEFWNQLAENFDLTFQLLEEMAEEQGIDLNEVAAEEAGADKDWFRKEIEEHPLVILAQRYFASVDSWLKENKTALDNKIKDHEELIEMDIGQDENADKILKIKDFSDIIQWYYTMIPIKVRRVVNDLVSPVAEDQPPIQNDMNGTAKLMSICVERSMFAWKGMMEGMPELEDGIIEKLIVLAEMKRGIETSFPNAQKFIRPGFDEEV